MTGKVAVAEGDGIGPEIMHAVLKIFKAVEVPLEYEFVEMGKSVFDQGNTSGMTKKAQEAIEDIGVLFKGPMETPKGKGVKSINVTARKFWNTYANIRKFTQLPGVDTLFTRAGIPINMTIVRENIEDTYGGIEHFLTEDVAFGRRIISRPGTRKVHRFAFEYAVKRGINRIFCGHKANIMKQTDGLFLETFYEVAKDFPTIKADDVIVDDLAMKMVKSPEIFQMVVLPNLMGDIISDLCAGLVGGLGFAPSGNIGDHVSIFEAVHGTAPDISGKNMANPTALLLSGIFMLNNLGLLSHAASVENALVYTLEQKYATADFAGKDYKALSTTDFTDKIIENLGKIPTHKVAIPRSGFVSLIGESLRPKKNIIYPQIDKKITIKGIDIFVDSLLQPDVLAAKVKTLLLDGFNLKMISNRGTSVWPGGSVLTELTTQYCVRITSSKQDEDRTKLLQQVIEIQRDITVCSTEFILDIDGKQAYSVAQGQ